jgi:hypothetical protein
MPVDSRASFLQADDFGPETIVEHSLAHTDELVVRIAGPSFNSGGRWSRAVR